MADADGRFGFQIDLQVVPTGDDSQLDLDREATPLCTPNFMNSQHQPSFDDLFYTPAPQLQQKLISCYQGEHDSLAAYSAQNSASENWDTAASSSQRFLKQETEPVEFSACASQRKFSDDSAFSGKIEPCSPMSDAETRRSSESDASIADEPTMFYADFDASLEIYRDLILRHLVQDIRGTCCKLGIPPGKANVGSPIG